MGAKRTFGDPAKTSFPYSFAYAVRAGLEVAILGVDQPLIRAAELTIFVEG